MPLAYPQPTLADELVLLRPWEDTDFPLLEEACDDEYVALIERLPMPFDAARGLAWIEQKRAALVDERGWELAIVENGGVDAVGGIGIVFRHPPGAAEPGCWVIERKRNRGIAERATRLICRWALTADTGIARVQATVEPWNTASQQVLEKVGFVKEGLLRSYASWRGAREDVFMYSLLPGDL